MINKSFTDSANSPIRAVFFDCDNVLAFTEELHIAKTIAIASEMGVTVTRAEWPNFQGLGDHRIFEEILVPRGAKGNLSDFIRRTSEHYNRGVDNIRPRDGILPVLELTERFPRLVITAGDELQVTRNMRCLPDFLPLHTIHADLIKPELRKPHRGHCDAGVQFLCDKFGWEDTPGLRRRILYIDDSNTGAQSGRDAGLTTIQWVLEPDHKGLDGVYAVVHSPEDLLLTVQNLLDNGPQMSIGLHRREQMELGQLRI